MRYIASLILLLALVSSCKKKYDWHNTDLSTKPDLLLDEIGSTVYALDSLTGFYNRYLRYHTVDGKNYLSILNHINDRIQTYDPKTGEMVWSLNLEREGPDSPGTRPGGFYFDSFDSVYVFDSWSGKISLLNNDGKILAKYNTVLQGKNSGYAYPIVQSGSPLIKTGDQFYLSGIIPGGWRGVKLLERPMMRFDVSLTKLDYWLDRPSINTEFNWGNDLLNYIYHDYDTVNNEFIISYANYENIIRADFSSVKHSKKTPSLFFKELQPFSNDFNYKPTKKELDLYYFSVPYYWAVFYDHRTKRTYRLASIPQSKEKIAEGIRDNMTSVIVLDSMMTKIGEALIDKKKYDPRMIYIDERGFNIASVQKFMINEDQLAFELIDFKLNK